MKRILLFVSIICSLGPLLFGAPFATDRTKLFLRTIDGSRATVDPLSIDSEAQIIQEYNAFTLISVPTTSRSTAVARAAAVELVVEDGDYLNMIHTPAAVDIDPRTTPSATFSSDAVTSTGLYLVQFTGPTLDEWMVALEDAGATIYYYVPQATYIIGANNDAMASIANLPNVQWVHTFDAPWKLFVAPNSIDGIGDAFVEIARLPGYEAAVDQIKAASVSFEAAPATSKTQLLRVGATVATLAALVNNTCVIGIEPVPTGNVSDERVAQSVTTNVNAPNTQPTNPTTYKSWLSSTCSSCTALYNDGFAIDIADMGVDTNETSLQHTDFLYPGGSTYRVVWGHNYTTESNYDIGGHGTMVAGVAAGNPRFGGPYQDTLSYYLGEGIAPSAKIVSTKIANQYGVVVEDETTNNILSWAQDAIAQGAYIQSHSHNDYGAGSLIYSVYSKMFDEAVRDSNGWLDHPNPGGHPISIVISAGNINQNNNNSQVVSPANAKNVLTVGATESYRPNTLCTDQTSVPAASLKNIWLYSARGTVTGVYKPDVVAPATAVVAQRTQYSLANLLAWCDPNFQNAQSHYILSSGTSFSAPVGAAAELLINRKMASTPGTVSPALLKAAVIGSAVDLSGGIDRRTSATLGHRPTTPQGFGRISLVKALSSTPIKWTLDQTQQLATGDLYTRTFSASDMTKPVVVVMTYTDRPGTSSSSVYLINDLNVRLRFPSCYYVFGNQFDTATGYSRAYNCLIYPLPSDIANNVEMIYYDPNLIQSGGVFTLELEAKNVPLNAVPGAAGNRQDFAIWVYNAQ